MCVSLYSVHLSSELTNEQVTVGVTVYSIWTIDLDPFQSQDPLKTTMHQILHNSVQKKGIWHPDYMYKNTSISRQIKTVQCRQQPHEY